jgi:hypothetical protein
LERTAPLLRNSRRGPRRSAPSRSAFRGRAAARRHLVMHVVMVMMVVPPVVVVMMRLLHRRGCSGRGGFLRPGVTRKADRESGRGDKTGWLLPPQIPPCASGKELRRVVRVDQADAVSPDT